MFDNFFVVRVFPLSIQVCVPKEATDAQVVEFANRARLCGTENGWQIRKQGDESLAGCNERVQCELEAGKVHIMLDA